MPAGGGRQYWLCVLLAVLPLIGCRRTDLLESELRAKDAQYRCALDEQARAENRVDSLQREVACLRQSGPQPTPEQAATVFGVRRLTLGRSTGGYDKDTLPGDELLQVVVEPRDCDDHVIKAPGTLQVFALEVTPQGIKVPISSWELGPEELRRAWKQGLLSTGYTLLLPWRQCPRTDTVRVVVRLIVTDDRVYEADKDVKVHVMPGAVAATPSETALPPFEAGPALPPNSEPPLTLPPPRTLPVPTSQDPFLLPSRRVQPVPDEAPISRISGSTPWSAPAERGTGSVGIGPPQPLNLTPPPPSP